MTRKTRDYYNAWFLLFYFTMIDCESISALNERMLVCGFIKKKAYIIFQSR